MDDLVGTSWIDNLFEMTDDKIRIKLIERTIDYEIGDSRRDMISRLCHLPLFCLY